MNETQIRVQHPSPPRPVRTILNAVVSTVLRSPWHGMRSHRLILLTFTGRKSGKQFTTPIRYVREGETLQMAVVYPWWKNLLEEATVRVLLRGQWRTGIAEVFAQSGKMAIVKIHLRD